ncbi:hypothetical protein, partial [Bacillus cereus]|uniref:hypothetical protein n=1 Tax=Bacillus cereus TaxID=1396 RepID=UPI000BEDD8BA
LACETEVNAATFSTSSLDPKWGPIDLVERTLVGTKISFTSPNTINLKPGNYVVNYTLMGNPSGINSEIVLVGLDVNGLSIPETTLGSSSLGTTNCYPRATGSYSLSISANSTLQLSARTNVLYDVPSANSTLKATNAQTAQITILEI